MTLNMSDPLDRLYLECIPTRPTPFDTCLMADGPTAAFAVLERQREAWAYPEPSAEDAA